MKVVEKLFINYLQTPSNEYVNKYLAAKAVLDITEPQGSQTLKEVHDLRDRIHARVPISVFKAQLFLSSNDKTLTLKIDGKEVTYSKMRGHEYLMAEFLGDFLDEINARVVRSMAKYNTDRGRGPKDTTSFTDLV